jgi:hypothetical protein
MVRGLSMELAEAHATAVSAAATVKVGSQRFTSATELRP